MTPWVAILPALAVIALVIAIARSHMKGHLRPLGVLLDERPDDVPGFFPKGLEGHRQGRAVSIRLRPGGHNHPSRFHVKIACGAPLKFKIAKEGAGARIAKALHLMKDVRIGDPRLDERYVFSTADPEPFSRWVRDTPEVRTAIEDLFDRCDMNEVSMDDGNIIATRVHFGGSHTEVDRVRDILERLEILARSLEGGSILPSRSST